METYKKAFDSLKSFFSPSGEEFTTKHIEGVEFELKYEGLTIGKLISEENGWKFIYSDEFKEQEEIEPIADFPDKEKVYLSKNLWPFFASRIPSSATPYVQKKARKENININNITEMLIQFGERSINNPFILKLIA